MERQPARTDRPLVSVVTPTYNCAAFIRETVDSVLAQTYDNWEHIIVDDGSSDNTPEIMEAYGDEPRIRYVIQPRTGQSYTRNHAIRLAQGEFICFLDADDVWLPDKLEKSLAAFEKNPQADILYGDYINIDEWGRETSRHNMKRYSGNILKPLLRDNCVSFNTTMVRRKCLDEMGGQNESYNLAPDWDMWLRFATRYTFYYLPEYLTCYRTRRNQISSDKEARLEANQRILRNFLAQYPGVIEPRETREVWGFFFTRKGRSYASKGKIGVALQSYMWALFYAPWKIWPWRALAKLVLLR